jgi:hypothetical protein
MGLAMAAKTAYSIFMQTVSRKPKTAAGRTPKATASHISATAKPARKAARASKTSASAETRKLISAAVKKYVTTNHDAILEQLIADPELAGLLAEIDRNLDASEQRTARLLAA